jgi:hypothetical protein
MRNSQSLEKLFLILIKSLAKLFLILIKSLFSSQAITENENVDQFYDSDTRKTHAKAGTYDESVFLNPKTGCFKFPKYSHNKQCLIKIKDETDWAETRKEIWEDLYPEEKKNFSIRDFEEHSATLCPEYLIDPFSKLFDGSKVKHLAPYSYLKGHGEEIQDILNEIDFPDDDDDMPGYIRIDADWEEKLLKDGFIDPIETQQDIENRAYLHSIGYKDAIKSEATLKSLKVPELKEINKKLGYRISRKKDELVKQVINILDEKKPKGGVPNKKFLSLMNDLFGLYISDLKASLIRYHPLLHEYVWECVEADCECFPLEKKVKEIINSKYWEDHLE